MEGIDNRSDMLIQHLQAIPPINLILYKLTLSIISIDAQIKYRVENPTAILLSMLTC